MQHSLKNFTRTLLTWVFRNTVFIRCAFFFGFLLASHGAEACLPENNDFLKKDTLNVCSPNGQWCLSFEPQSEWGRFTHIDKVFREKTPFPFSFFKPEISRSPFKTLSAAGQFVRRGKVVINNAGWRVEKLFNTLQIFNPEGILSHQYDAKEIMPSAYIESIESLAAQLSYRDLACYIFESRPWVNLRGPKPGLEFRDNHLVIRTFVEASYH